MMKLLFPINLIFFFILSILFGTFINGSNDIPKQLFCIDEECKETISSGRSSKSIDARFGTLTTVKTSFVFKIKGKNANADNPLWLIEYNNLHGFIDSSFVREIKNSVRTDTTIVRNPHYTDRFADETEDGEDERGAGSGLFSGREQSDTPQQPEEREQHEEPETNGDETENFSEKSQKNSPEINKLINGGIDNHTKIDGDSKTPKKPNEIPSKTENQSIESPTKSINNERERSEIPAKTNDIQSKSNRDESKTDNQPIQIERNTQSIESPTKSINNERKQPEIIDKTNNPKRDESKTDNQSIESPTKSINREKERSEIPAKTIDIQSNQKLDESKTDNQPIQVERNTQSIESPTKSINNDRKQPEIIDKMNNPKRDESKTDNQPIESPTKSINSERKHPEIIDKTNSSNRDKSKTENQSQTKPINSERKQPEIPAETNDIQSSVTRDELKPVKNPPGNQSNNRNDKPQESVQSIVNKAPPKSPDNLHSNPIPSQPVNSDRNKPKSSPQSSVDGDRIAAEQARLKAPETVDKKPNVPSDQFPSRPVNGDHNEPVKTSASQSKDSSRKSEINHEADKKETTQSEPSEAEIKSPSPDGNQSDPGPKDSPPKPLEPVSQPIESPLGISEKSALDQSHTRQYPSDSIVNETLDKQSQPVDEDRDRSEPIDKSAQIIDDPWLKSSTPPPIDPPPPPSRSSPLFKLAVKLDALSQSLVKSALLRLGFDDRSDLHRFSTTWLHMPLESLVSLAVLFVVSLWVVLSPKVFRFNRDWRAEHSRQSRVVAELESKLQSIEEVRLKLAEQNHNFEKVIEECRAETTKIQEDARDSKNTLRAELDHVQTLNETAIKNLQIDLDHKSRQCDLFEREIVAKLDEIDRLTSENQSTVTQFEHDKSVLRASIESLEHELATARSERSDLDATLARRARELEELQSIIDGLRHDLDERDQSLKQIEKSIDTLQSFSSMTTDQLIEQKSIALQLTKTQSELEATLFQANRLEEDLSEKIEEIGRLNEANRTLEERSIEAEQERSRAVQSKEAAEMKLKVLSDYWNSKEVEMTKKLGHSVVESSQSMDQVEQLRHRIGILESENEELSKTVLKLKSEVKEAHSFASRCKSDANEQISELFVKASGLERRLAVEQDETKKLRATLSRYIGPVKSQNAAVTSLNHTTRDPNRPPSRQSGASEPPNGSPFTQPPQMPFLPFLFNPQPQQPQYHPQFPQSPNQNSSSFSGRNSVNSKKSNNT